MKIPKKWKLIGDKKPCHYVGETYDGNLRLIVYRQWLPWKRYYDYKVIEDWALYEDLYFKRYGKFPENGKTFDGHRPIFPY